MRNMAKVLACALLMMSLLIPAFGVISQPQADVSRLEGNRSESASTYGFGSDDFSDPANTMVYGSANVSGGNLTLNDIYLHSDFNDGTLQGWEIVNNYIETQNKYMRINNGMVRVNVTFDNFKMDFDLMLAKLDVKGYNEGYKFFFHGGPKCLFSCTYENENDTLYYAGTNDRIYYKTNRISYYPVAMRWYHFQIIHEQEYFNISIDGIKKVSMNITSFLDITQIYLAASSWGDVYIDNVVIHTDDSHGHAITQQIALPYNRLWDKVEINKTENPLGTVRFSVLRPYANHVFPHHENLTGTSEDISDIFLYETDKLYLEFWLDGLDRNFPSVDWWRIYWRPDLPVQYYSIPEVRVWEDRPQENALNLTNYFTDTYTAGQDLLFQVSYASNPEHVKAVINGYNLSIELPTKDWYGTETIRVNCSDGEFVTESSTIKVIVNPVNDPPVIASMPDFEAIEEAVSVLNLTPYLSDVDDATDSLTVSTDCVNCTVDGQELFFHYTVGGIKEKVHLTVSDGRLTTEAFLNVSVRNVNDAPRISQIPKQIVTEEEPFILDLAPYLSDEDNAIGQLVVSSTDPAIASIDGRKITILFMESEPSRDVGFNVSDGLVTITGVVPVEIIPVNDPPILKSIGGQASTGPIEIKIPEGNDAWLPIVATDVDNQILHYYVTSDLTGIQVLNNGSLHIPTTRGNVGTFWAEITVDDLSNGTASVNVTISVENVNDPPALPKILSPTDGEMFEEGVNITFSGSYSDPDTILGQILLITWSSNLSGKLRQFTSEDAKPFILGNLTPGRHLITVTVSDGEFERSSNITMFVKAKTIEPPVNPGGGEKDNSRIILIAAVGTAVVVIVAIGGLIFARSQRRS